MDLTPSPFPNGKGSLLDEQRSIVVDLDNVHAQLASLPAHALGRLQSQTQEELRPLFGRALLPSAEGAPQGGAFKGEL